MRFLSSVVADGAASASAIWSLGPGILNDSWRLMEITVDYRKTSMSGTQIRCKWSIGRYQGKQRVLTLSTATSVNWMHNSSFKHAYNDNKKPLFSVVDFSPVREPDNGQPGLIANKNPTQWRVGENNGKVICVRRLYPLPRPPVWSNNFGVFS